MAKTIGRHKGRLDAAVALGQSIRRRIEALNRPMDDLCARTCPSCADPCCAHAKVWYDFKDLVYLHFGAPSIPPGQVIDSLDHTCRYLKAAGCTLPRVQRPFVCTWYLCAAQKARMNDLSNSRVQFIHNSLEALKSGRRRLECIYLGAIIRDGRWRSTFA